jgi:phosphotransferase system HPr-like phosphotransfer protein
MNIAPKLNERWVEPQLMDSEDPAAGFLLDLRECLEVPGIQHGRFLADRVGVVPKSESDVCVMQVVGRTDRHVIQLGSLATELVDMAVEPLELGKEIGVRKKAVDDSHAVARIECRHQLMAGFPDGFHMARGNVARRPDEPKSLFHLMQLTAQNNEAIAIDAEGQQPFDRRFRLIETRDQKEIELHVIMFFDRPDDASEKSPGLRTVKNRDELKTELGN